MSVLSGYIRTIRHRFTDGNYIKQSEWTSSNDIEMDDGSTLEEKMSDAYERIYAEDVLTDALLVDLNDKYSDTNKPKRVNSTTTTTNAIPDFESGIRYVHYYDTNNLIVECIGRTSENKPAIRYNSYIDGSWSGWSRGITESDFTVSNGILTLNWL